MLRPCRRHAIDPGRLWLRISVRSHKVNNIHCSRQSELQHQLRRWRIPQWSHWHRVLHDGRHHSTPTTIRSGQHRSLVRRWRLNWTHRLRWTYSDFRLPRHQSTSRWWHHKPTTILQSSLRQHVPTTKHPSNLQHGNRQKPIRRRNSRPRRNSRNPTFPLLRFYTYRRLIREFRRYSSLHILHNLHRRLRIFRKPKYAIQFLQQRQQIQKTFNPQWLRYNRRLWNFSRLRPSRCHRRYSITLQSTSILRRLSRRISRRL